METLVTEKAFRRISDLVEEASLVGDRRTRAYRRRRAVCKQEFLAELAELGGRWFDNRMRKQHG